MLIQLPLIASDCSLIDCSSIMAFSGADYSDPNRYLAFRDVIWRHIKGMVVSDRLKTVRQVWKELEFLDQDSCAQLRDCRDKFILATDQDTDFRVLNLISKYPKLIDHRIHYTREPADPYLIVYAQKTGFPIITEEKSLSQRRGDRKNRHLKIPDVCASEGVKCVNLKDFLRKEGLIK